MHRLWLFLVLLITTPFAFAESVQITSRPLSDVVIYPQREAFARVSSVNESKLSAEVSAKILSIPVREGQVVTAGTMLLRLDDGDFRLAMKQEKAAYASIQARLQLAEIQLARARELVSKNFLSREALNQREAELRTLQAEADLQKARVEVSRRNLEKCVIRSPYRAIVKARLGNVGETALPNTPLIHLIQADQLEVEVQVQADDMSSLRSGDDIQFLSLGKAYPVRLARIIPAVNRGEKTQSARFSFPEEAALPGSEGRVTWKDGTPHVPADLLVRRKDTLGIFIVQDGKARFVPLSRAQEGRPAAIRFKPGTAAIIDGRLRVTDGEPVTERKP